MSRLAWVIPNLGRGGQHERSDFGCCQLPVGRIAWRPGDTGMPRGATVSAQMLWGVGCYVLGFVLGALTYRAWISDAKELP